MPLLANKLLSLSGDECRLYNFQSAPLDSLTYHELLPIWSQTHATSNRQTILSPRLQHGQASISTATPPTSYTEPMKYGEHDTPTNSLAGPTNRPTHLPTYPSIWKRSLRCQWIFRAHSHVSFKLGRGPMPKSSPSPFSQQTPVQTLRLFAA
jgi:hypothetical protein